MQDGPLLRRDTERPKQRWQQLACSRERVRHNGVQGEHGSMRCSVRAVSENVEERRKQTRKISVRNMSTLGSVRGREQ